MYRVGIKEELLARHYLVGDFEEETQPHEHTYRVEWICSADRLDENGFSVDIALMESSLQGVLSEISGRLINDFEFFKGKQASVENLAVFISLELRSTLRDHGYDTSALTDMEIRIWESESAWASYKTDTP